MPSRCAVGVFARAPVPGQTKTRLMPLVGAQGAAQVHALLTRRAVQAALDAGIGPVCLWTAGDAGHPFFGTLPEGVRCLPQPDGDLGQRMRHALAHMRTLAPCALVIGSDCAVMDADLLREAATALAHEDLVFTPAEDGGYVLVGARVDTPVPFGDLTWGSADVMNETRRRLTGAGLRWAETGTRWDIDRPEDLLRAQARGLLPNAF